MRMALMELLVLLGFAEIPASLDLPVVREHQVPLERLALRVLMVSLGQLVWLVWQDCLVQLVPLDLVEQMDQREAVVLLVLRDP